MTRSIPAICGTLLAILLLCSPASAWAAAPRQFGILYEPWHCLVKGHEVHDISQYLAGKQQLGPAPEFHWWGKPAAGYYCLSDNDDVLRRHEPRHVLLQAAYADAATGLLDIARLQDFLKRIKGRIRHIALSRPSPLSVPVLLEMGREAINGEAREAMLREAADALIKEAMEGG